MCFSNKQQQGNRGLSETSFQIQHHCIHVRNNYTMSRKEPCLSPCYIDIRQSWLILLLGTFLVENKVTLVFDINVLHRFFEKFNMLLPSIRETYFCKVLSLALVSQTEGITASEIRYFGPIFLAKFRRFYG